MMQRNKLFKQLMGALFKAIRVVEYLQKKVDSINSNESQTQNVQQASTEQQS